MSRVEYGETVRPVAALFAATGVVSSLVGTNVRKSCANLFDDVE